MAPHLYWFYEFVADSLGRRLDRPVELVEGSSYDQLDTGFDVAFVCGLAYVIWGRAMEPVAAPVLAGDRYAAKPIYFSEVIVRRDSGIRSFADRRGRSWAYNEPFSQSGYGIMRYHLARVGESLAYFSRIVEAGWHEVALRLVAGGDVDAAAIDSHVLANMLPDHPELAAQLRIIDCLGPSPTQPVVVARRLPEPLKAALSMALVDLADDSRVQGALQRAMVAHFVNVDDAAYDPIREMHKAAQATALPGARKAVLLTVPQQEPEKS